MTALEQLQELAQYAYKISNDDAYNDDTVLQLLLDKIYTDTSTCTSCGVSYTRLKASGDCVYCWYNNHYTII